jgi:CO dehydrogenase maturation factor
MKIAVAGKGGVGKTFVAGTLARMLARDDYNVLVVDADPNINTASTLGIPSEVAENVVPLSENSSLIEEKTGLKPGESFGKIFKMTPNVKDIVERFGIEGPDGVQLLIMGTVKEGDSGCMCPSNALLRVLIQHLLIQRKDVLVMDMVAGLEHLGRGTTRRMDCMLIIVEPRMKSMDTMKRIVKLSREIEIKELFAVGNKIRSPREDDFIEKKTSEMKIPLICKIPFDESVIEADMLGKAPLDYNENSQAIKAINNLKKFLKNRYG